MSKPIKVLIVDDEKNLRTTLADILREEGYDVATAENGQSAVDLCTRDTFDVILMDVRLPDLNGVEAFRQIRRHREGVRVIMMSAYTLDDLKQEALKEGALAFLSKPLDIDTILHLVAEAADTTILLVENDAQAAEPVCETLRKQGYRVTMVRTPFEALALVEQIHYNVVFIDAQLPAMNGLDLYLQIKRITPATVAVMITGMEEEFERIAREAVRQTAYTMLRKPLDLDYLLALLKRITGQRVSGTMQKPQLD